MKGFTRKEAKKMDRTRNDLLNEYRNADLTKRLNLYLQHRDLRPEFMVMDQNEVRTKAVRKTAGSKSFSRFFTCPFGKVGWHCAGTRG